MLSYLPASGQFPYVKCAHLYLHDTQDFKSTVGAEEYEKFTTQSNFNIQRILKFWSGLSSGTTLEQSLMKKHENFGGLTYSRGVSDSSLARKTQGMIALQHIYDEIENFCGVDLISSDQHLGISDSEIQRDNDNYRKMMDWFNHYIPFP
ncbi:hypothetical protein AVEN_266988-1 [Araneus ventricosus]|uniref:Uncharacterized protein n=1 Tax=Araneus ventricosus TaxID=182803 RepID=A0A4Y2WXV5_ARAVE|nr:hypothetical protein AVEN_266988-1 [Araneus ventricosus]